MALLTNALSSLISTGNDAQSNLYEVIFEGGYLTDINTALSLRCKGFTPNLPSQQTYQVKYVTASIDRPVAKITLDRSFSLDFRLDDYWDVYKALLKQQNLTMNAQKSYVSIDLNELKSQMKLFNVYVNLLDKLDEDSEGVVRRLFNFKDCWIEEISTSQFTTSSSDVITATCKIRYLEMEDWQSGLKSTNANETGHTSPMLNTVAPKTKYI